MKPTLFLATASTIFALVSIAHIIRIFMHIPIIVRGTELPMCLSWIALVGTSLLSIWGFNVAFNKKETKN